MLFLVDHPCHSSERVVSRLGASGAILIISPPPPISLSILLIISDLQVQNWLVLDPILRNVRFRKKWTKRSIGREWAVVLWALCATVVYASANMQPVLGSRFTLCGFVLHDVQILGVQLRSIWQTFSLAMNTSGSFLLLFPALAKSANAEHAHETGHRISFYFSAYSILRRVQKSNIHIYQGCSPARVLEIKQIDKRGHHQEFKKLKGWHATYQN